MYKSILTLKSAAAHFCLSASNFCLLQKLFLSALFFPLNFSKASCICKDSKYKGLCFQILTETLAKHQYRYLEHLFSFEIGREPRSFLDQRHFMIF